MPANVVSTPDASVALLALDPAMKRPGDREAVAKRRTEQIGSFLTQAERAVAAEEFDAAIAACEEVLVRDSDHSGALALLDRIKGILDEREAIATARRAEACTDEAKRHFAEGRQAQAFELLAAFDPPHPLIDAAIEELQAEARRLEQVRLERERELARQRAEAERQRLEAERLRLEAERLQREAEARQMRRERVAAEIETIRTSLQAGEPDAAFERLETLARVADLSDEVGERTADLQTLRDEIQAAIAEAERVEALARAVAEHVARAAGMFARSDYAGALARLESALALDPTSKAAAALRARVVEQQHSARRTSASPSPAPAAPAAVTRPSSAAAAPAPPVVMAHQPPAAARPGVAQSAVAHAALVVEAAPVQPTTTIAFPDGRGAIDLFASEHEITDDATRAAQARPVPRQSTAGGRKEPARAVAAPTRVDRRVSPLAAKDAAKDGAKATKHALFAAVGALVLVAAMWSAFRGASGAEAPASPAPVVDASSSTPLIDAAAAPAVASPAGRAPGTGVAEPAFTPSAAVQAPAVPTASGASASAERRRTNDRPSGAPTAEARAARSAAAPVATARTPAPPRPSTPTAASTPTQAAVAQAELPLTTRFGPDTAPAPPAADRQVPAPSGGSGTPRVRESSPARDGEPAAALPTGSATASALAVQAADERAVRATLAAYAAAYSGLDVDGVKRVFPAVNEPALRRAFSTLRSQQVELQGEQMSVSGDAATVSCTLVASAVGQVGSPTPRRDARRVVFNLIKRNGEWVIVDRR